MFSHVMVGTNDFEKSKAFYTATFAVLGGREPIEDTTPSGIRRAFWIHNGGTFGISEPIDGEAATCANGATIGFACDSLEQAQAWHDAGVAAGGTSIEDPPGPRSGSMGTMNLAYLRDPDGNKLCAMHRAG